MNSREERGDRISHDSHAQLVLAGGVSMAFAILMIAGLTQIGLNMESEKDIEPSLGPEFIHLVDEFEKAIDYQYNTTNQTAEESFTSSSELFISMEYYYGVIMEFTILNNTGSSGNETVEYSISMQTQNQYLHQERTIVLIR